MQMNELLKHIQCLPKAENRTEYATLISLVDIEGEAHLVLERRAADMETQPSEISLPGGMVEKGECWQEAAVRETSEELLLPLSSIEYICDLYPQTIGNTNIVHCGLGYISNLELISRDPKEVDEVYYIPLSFFLENDPEHYEVTMERNFPPDFPFDSIPNGKDYNWHSSKHDIPFYFYEDLVIWGLTARLINNSF